MKFHHIAIIVSDKKLSLAFYQELLGFQLVKETFRAERKSWKIDLEKVGMRLEIFTFIDAPLRASYPEAQGLRHLAFEVGDLDQWYQKLKSKDVGVEEIRLDQDTGKRFFFFHDPDKLPIEMYEA